MNNRANIMYFIEHLCDVAAKDGHQDYVRMMQRDILRVVDAVAPEDGSGAANVKVVRKVLSSLLSPVRKMLTTNQVLQGLQTKSYLLAQTVVEIEDCLKERDNLPGTLGFSSPVCEIYPTNGDATFEQEPSKPKANYARLDKKQVEQRIEEDRERHKRLREHIWAVAQDNEDEFDKLWEETSEVGEDDYILYDEEFQERGRGAEEWADDHKIKSGGAGE